MTFAQSLWAGYTDDQKRQAPQFCPRCGQEFCGALGDTVLVYDEYEVAPGSWDCHCPACEWSGDISAD